MLRDGLFFILGMILMYLIMMLSNYGLRLPKTNTVAPVVRSITKPTPTPTPKPVTFRDIDKQYVRELWKKKTDQDIAFAIIKAESDNDCKFTDPVTGTKGLFGISPTNDYRFGKESPLSCTANIDVAKEIWDSEGWSAWQVYTNGEYKKFL